LLTNFIGKLAGSAFNSLLYGGGAADMGQAGIFNGSGMAPGPTSFAEEVARGGAFDEGRLLKMAKGAIVSRPTIFPMANGAGLMGEDGPEAVMPLTRTRSGDLGVRASGGGGGIVVNIINNNGSQVSTQEKENPAGGIQLDVMIDQAVAKKLTQANSYSNKAMKQNFGTRETLVAR